MKIVWRIVLIFALALLILGVAAIGVSLFTGGSLEGVRNNVPLMNYEKNYAEETPTALRVDVPGGRLTIETGDVLRVEARNVTESGFDCRIENGALIVVERQETSWADSLSRLISLRKAEPEYHIWLPAELTLTRAELHMAAGTAQINGLRADVTQLQMAAGSVAVSGLRAQSALIEMAAGDLALTDLDTQVLSLQSAAGSVGVSGTVRQRCTVDLAAGSAALKLTGSAGDYAAQIEVVGGSISYDGHSYNLGRYTVGSGENAMSLRCGAGSVSVRFYG